MKILCCPACYGTLELVENIEKKKGLASLLIVKCHCGYSHEFYTSSSSSHQSFDINKRAVYTFRALGQGYSGITKFTSLMNMPTPMTHNNYDKVVTKVCSVAKDVALETMQDAANEIKGEEEGTVNTAVSVDGSWQKRGYSSFNGVVTAISMKTGKILDIEPLTRMCLGCKSAEAYRLSDPDRYNQWKANHVCLKNHCGSAGAMEITGSTRIFKRSIEKNNMCYNEYYGDGDSKSFMKVKNIYEGLTVKKLECVGHVQKRVGTRLRALKRKKKEIYVAEKKSASKEKTVVEKNHFDKLTYAVIDKLQNYYGIAVRSNSNDLTGMQKAIRATLYHVASSETNNNHSQCSLGEKSWCRFNQDVVTGKNTFKHGSGLPREVVIELLPMYIELSSDELLSKCLHGKTQNQNESFNATIWERLPKTKYNSFTHLELATYDAAACFNIGRKATILMYEKLEMKPGSYVVHGCAKLNRKRLSRSEYRNKIIVKKRRTVLRGKAKKGEDSQLDKEGTVYAPGVF